jgi:hypothetical protein
MARTSRELAVAQRPHLPAQGLLGDRNPVLVPEPLDQINKPPAHHPVHGRNRATLNDAGQGCAMSIGEPGGLARWLVVDQPLGSVALNLTTQSRAICSVTPPIRAASVREAPS